MDSDRIIERLYVFSVIFGVTFTIIGVGFLTYVATHYILKYW